MTAQHGKRPTRGIAPGDFPALREFLRGYFHQDMADEYGSAEGAVRQFCRDADAGQRQAVAQEWERLVQQMAGWPLAAMNAILTEKLGSAYLLGSPEEIKKISAVLGGSQA